MLKLLRITTPGPGLAAGDVLHFVVLIAGPTEPARAELTTGPDPEAAVILSIAANPNSSAVLYLPLPLRLTQPLWVRLAGAEAQVFLGWTMEAG